MTSALLSLYQDRIRPDFVRLIIQDTPDPDDSHQFVMELARLQALVRDPQPPD